MDAHRKAVSRISSQVFSFHQRKVPFRLYHGSTNSTKLHKVDPDRMVDTSALNHVLKVDVESKTCLVEPNVPMDQLVDELMLHGLLPAVVMEFPGITVGGGFAGTAGESSGFKYGFFEHTVQWIEFVLANGEVVSASPHENAELFYGAAGTFGTLGVTTLLELKLIDWQPYVQLTYHPTTNYADTISKLHLAIDDSTNDYVDGIIFSPTQGVIVTGRLTSTPSPSVHRQTFSRPQDPWFYLHARAQIASTTTTTTTPVTDITPVRDYLFRYDCGAFWTGRYAFTYFLCPFNRITRYILDYFMHTRVMYHALHASGHSKKYMIQDLLLPSATAEQFLHFVEEHHNLFPLWLCPFRPQREISLWPRLQTSSTSSKSSTSSPQSSTTTDTTKKETFINIGVWGPGPSSYPSFIASNRLLEKTVRSLGGLKWLYAQAYYTQDEFGEIYDQEWYTNLRKKYGAEYLPSVFDKVRVDLGDSETGTEKQGWREWVWENVWPVSGVYGVLSTVPLMLGRGRGEYLLGGRDKARREGEGKEQ